MKKMQTVTVTCECPSTTMSLPIDENGRIDVPQFQCTRCKSMCEIQIIEPKPGTTRRRRRR